MTAGQSRYRMRRHARRLRRYGLEPIAIVNPGDPLPEIAIVVVGRWLWRYRSELTPATVALAVFGSAWLLHRSYPHWWPTIATAATVTAALAILKGARAGLVTPAERWYAALVVIISGGWLATATAVGPETRPLPAVLLAAGLVLAVPWRPALDAISQQALDQRAQAAPDAPAHSADPDSHADAEDGLGESRGAPDAMLWVALCMAPDDGVVVADLMAETGMSRPWVYQRLHELTERGQATQVSRGRWRAL